MALLPDEPNAEEKQEQLTEDYETPFRPAADLTRELDDTHPATDTDLEESDLYENGTSQAAGAEEPSPGIPHIADADHS